MREVIMGRACTTNANERASKVVAVTKTPGDAAQALALGEQVVDGRVPKAAGVAHQPVVGVGSRQLPVLLVGVSTGAFGQRLLAHRERQYEGEGHEGQGPAEDGVEGRGALRRARLRGVEPCSEDRSEECGIVISVEVPPGSSRGYETSPAAFLRS
ncbi:hypothetical protein [Streptomyces sp. NPDC008001]|uniref:hypothetical protein n=1 Tax=Streptomyces sp. NPDC008001 TaxID=3364804 RepID=UPI0036E4C9C9